MLPTLLLLDFYNIPRLFSLYFAVADFQASVGVKIEIYAFGLHDPRVDQRSKVGLKDTNVLLMVLFSDSDSTQEIKCVLKLSNNKLLWIPRMPLMLLWAESLVVTRVACVSTLAERLTSSGPEHATGRTSACINLCFSDIERTEEVDLLCGVKNKFLRKVRINYQEHKRIVSQEVNLSPEATDTRGP